MRENAPFYAYHPPFATKESIVEDMLANPGQNIPICCITPRGNSSTAFLLRICIGFLGFFGAPEYNLI